MPSDDLIPRFDPDRASPEELREEAQGLDAIAADLVLMRLRGHFDNEDCAAALKLHMRLRDRAGDLNRRAMLLDQAPINREAV